MHCLRTLKPWQDGVNIVSPGALTWEHGGSSVSKAFEKLRSDPELAERIAQAGHELVRRALRPESVRRCVGTAKAKP